MKEKLNAKEFFDKRARFYTKVSKWTVNERLNKKTDKFLESIEGDIAIEIGAGTGVLISRLKNFKRKIALDISMEMLSQIDDNRIEVVVGDVHSLKFPNNYFDLVICRQLLHYCSLDIALANIERVLKKNGLLHVVQVVDFKGVPNRWDQKWAGFRNVYNRKHLRTAELENSFEKFSLKVLKKEKLILRNSYSWPQFFLKHDIPKEKEQDVMSFFKFTPKSISDIIKLKLTQKTISYDRVIGIWLLQKE